MDVVRKEWEQDIIGDPTKVWDYFSRPENLKNITPPSMDFRIRSDIQGKPMYEGMMIVYKVSPVLGVSMTWATEITHIRPGVFFIDEQRIGPYAMWHHEHWFEPIEGGVRMKDILHYAIPFGPLGTIANALFVESKVDEIFKFRFRAVEDLVAKGVFRS